MAKPPYGHIASIAKHGSDEELLKLRDEIRWLGRWTDDLHGELRAIWRASEVLIGPENYDEISGTDLRDVTIRLKLTTREIDILTTILNEDNS